MKRLTAAFATLLRDPRTLHIVIALGVLAKKRAPLPLMILGFLALIGVTVTPLQTLGLVLGFVAVIGLELLANMTPATQAGRAGVAR